MGDTLLNGRAAEVSELAAIADGRRCEREREPASRPVTDLFAELS